MRLAGLVFVAAFTSSFFTTMFSTAVGDQIATLLSTDREQSDRFGAAMAFDGGTLLIGARDDDNRGSAYVFDTDSGEQLRKLIPNDREILGWFGNSVALDGGVALVGAPRDDANGAESGAAYVFDVATGIQLAKLVADDGAEYDYFGYSVALDGGIAIVGSPEDDDFGQSSGSVYIFDIATGRQLAKHTSIDNATGHRYGISVAIEDGVAVVGADREGAFGGGRGSAYLVDVVEGTQIARLTPTDGLDYRNFGGSVAMNDGVALVGAIVKTAGSYHAASGFAFDASTGQPLVSFSPSDAAEVQHIALSVALDDGYAVIGEYKDTNSTRQSGSAYLYDVASGQQLGKVETAQASYGDRFGASVAIGRQSLYVGATHYLDVAGSTGAVHVFDLPVPEPAGSGLVIAALTLAAFQRQVLRR